MEKCFPVGIGMNPVANALVVGFNHFSKKVGRDKLAALRACIIRSNTPCKTAISDGLGYAADETLMAEVKAAADTLNSDSDYAWNLAVILAADSGTVSSKNVNTLGSLVSVYHRLREDVARKAAAPKVAGFIGKVGDRLRDFDVNVTAVRSLEGDYGTTTLMVGTTDDGHTVKWFASGDRDWQAGDRLHFGAATVKAHETWEGTDQTALTRGHKVEVIDQG